MENPGSDLGYAILEILQKQGQPMGSGTLHDALRERGDKLSAPTIGRKLRDLEHRGLVSKVGLEGRTLTTAGEKVLEEQRQRRELATSGEKLLKLLKRKGREDIIDQLTTRRLIECETAALAAQNADERQMRELERFIQQGYDLVEHGESGIQADVEFHEAIADMSGNGVFSAIVKTLRSQALLNQVVAAIRTKVGGRLVVDHEDIISAIKGHKPDEARKAMGQHLDGLIFDVDRYWELAFPRRKSHRPGRLLDQVP